MSGEESLGIGSGLPYQVFTTKNVPLIPESQVVTVDGVEWVQVWDFDASGPEDNHYVMGAEHGTIQFGDGVHGRIPPQNKEIRITYRYGGGREGNVDAETITRIDIPGVAVTNPFPAWGGTEEESIKEAFIRFRRDLKIPYAAVTAADFEYVATATPGLRVARAKAVVVSENKVAVAVVPYSPLEKPLPSDGFKKTVCEHIDMHRLLTTSIQVRDPGYVRVSMNAHIRVPGGYSPELVKQRVTVALNKFLSPIKREPGDNAWPFGRAVYRSEVFEVIEEVDGAECVVELYLRGEEGSFRYKEGNIMIGPLSLVYPGRHGIEIIEQTTVCKRGDYEQG